MHVEASCGRALRGTTNPTRQSGCASFSRGRGGDDVDYRYEKTGTRASVLECPLYEGEAWGLLLAFVAFVHSLDDGFGQIERGIGKKYVVSLF